MLRARLVAIVDTTRLQLRVVQHGRSMVFAAKMHLIDAGLVDLGSLTSREVGNVVRAVRHALRTAPIAIYARPGKDRSDTIANACGAGADTVILAGFDELSTVVRRLVQRMGSSRELQDVITRVGAATPLDLQEPVAFYLTHPMQRQSVGAAAAAIGISRRTLVNRFAREEWPSPCIVAAWCRLLVAARLLEDQTMTAESVASFLGLRSGAALAALGRRHARLGISDLRHLGLLGVLPRFWQAVSGQRIARVADH